jgi:uncharacterized membrane protein
MVDAQDRRELGNTLMLIGLAIWVADLLIVFFLSAAVRVGQNSVFVVIISVLAFVGLGFLIAGYGFRASNE